jgi:hypothetical protein
LINIFTKNIEIEIPEQSDSPRSRVGIGCRKVHFGRDIDDNNKLCTIIEVDSFRNQKVENRANYTLECCSILLQGLSKD